MEQQCSENILTLLPSKESKLQEQRTGDQDNCIYLIHPSVFPPYESTTKLLKAEAQETQNVPQPGTASEIPASVQPYGMSILKALFI